MLPSYRMPSNDRFPNGLVLQFARVQLNHSWVAPNRIQSSPIRIEELS